jgi:hypothetical protein
MTSSQPPQPPPGGPNPEHGQQPPPGYGQQPPPGYAPPPPSGPPPGYGQQPPPGYGQQPPPGYGQQPPPGYGPPPAYGPPPQQQWAPQSFGQPQGSGAGASFDRTKLTMASYVIAGLTLLYLIISFFPWYSFGQDLFGFSLSGWTSGNVKTAFFLFLLASIWALLPAFTDLKLGFPRSWITVGLAALGFVLTLFAWIDTFNVDFSFWALLGTLVAAAILAFAVLALIPEMRNKSALAGGLTGAAQWANRPGPDFGSPGEPQGPGAFGQPTPPYGPAAQQYGQPPQQYATPPPPPPPPAHPGPSGPPSAGGPSGPPTSGGATASGEGSPERPAGS